MSGVNQDIPPFVIISGHYPPEVRSINKRGLNRAGLTPEQQKNINAAFRRLFRGGGPFLDRVKTMAVEGGHDENVRAMIDLILRSSQHRSGGIWSQLSGTLRIWKMDI
jgi:UDP-N-acetylglucosamine acyltransferase